MFNRIPAINSPRLRKMLLLLSMAALVVMWSYAARSETSPQPADPAPAEQESGPAQAHPDAPAPDRSQNAHQAEWRLRILQILLGPYAGERMGPFPR